MAITTQGHQVQVMPTYTPMDPSLVAFDPSQFSRGALASIQLADALSQRKAMLDRQSELAATRDARIAAEMAKYGLIAQTSPGEIEATNVRNRSISDLIPVETKSKIGDIEFAQSINAERRPADLLKAQAERSAASDQILDFLNRNSREALESKRIAEQEKMAAEIENLQAEAGLKMAQADAQSGKTPKPADQKFQDTVQELAPKIGMTPARVMEILQSGTPIQQRAMRKLVQSIQQPFSFLTEEELASIEKPQVTAVPQSGPARAMPSVQQPAAPSGAITRAQLIEAVKSGLPAAQAKEFAKQMGWE